jgi:hypothetical protein
MKRPITPKHTLKSYKTKRSFSRGTSMRAISDIEGMDVGLAAAFMDNFALQDLEIIVNLICIPA